MRQKDLRNQRSCPDVNKINVYCSRLGKWLILSTGTKSLPNCTETPALGWGWELMGWAVKLLSSNSVRKPISKTKVESNRGRP